MNPFQHYRSIQAPASDRGALCIPAAGSWSHWIEKNSEALGQTNAAFLGRSLSSLRSFAKAELVEKAWEYGRSRGTVGAVPRPKAERILLAGHQPELFHPGVWFKNFLLSAAATLTSSTAVNLIIDQDLCRSLSIKVPHRDRAGQLRMEPVALAPIDVAKPWEMTLVEREGAWKDFLERVRRSLNAIDSSTILLGDLWPCICQGIEHRRSIGETFAVARHCLERNSGLQTLELPIGFATQSSAFASFFFEIALNAERFASIYNRCRNEYRREHHIRNQAHPVPELAMDGEWIEIPFWIYSRSDPVRRGLWCRSLHRSEAVEWTDRKNRSWRFDIRRDLNRLEEFWMEIHESGFCLRPRALTNTIYARLVLSDLFLHGIGGGKYDQLTDRIIEQWLGVIPPTYAVATATAHLPIAFDTPAPTVSEARSKLWHFRHHWEDCADPTDAIQNPRIQLLANEKRGMLEQIPPRGEKKAWHQAMKRLNRELESHFHRRAEQLTSGIAEAEQVERQRRIAFSREFSYALFPKSPLIDDLKRLADRELLKRDPPQVSNGLE